MNAFRRSALLSVLGLFGACTQMKVAKLDPKTGRFPTRQRAKVVTSEATDLDNYKSLLLMPDNEFVRGQIENIRFFEETMTVDQLEEAIVKNGLVEQVPSVQDKIGIHKAYTAYKPFLWLRFKTRQSEAGVFGQFALIEPDSLLELFLVEKPLDYLHEGVNDQNTWYPMFNALVDYIDQNSKTWSAA